MTISWSGGGGPGDWGAGRGDGLRDFVVARGRERRQDNALYPAQGGRTTGHPTLVIAPEIQNCLHL